MLRMATLAALVLWIAPAWAQDQTPDASRERMEVRVFTQEPGREMTFEIRPDGHVNLKIVSEDSPTGKKEEKTYTADTLADFKTKYPEICREYGLQRYVPRLQGDRAARTWEELKEWFDQDWFWDERENLSRRFGRWWNEDLDNWLQEQRRLFERFRKIPAPPKEGKEVVKTAQPPAFGIRIDTPSEALSTHLGLEAGKGVIVLAVEPGSIADRHGLQKYDVIVTFDGKPVTDPATFRKDLREAMARDFELGILRKAQETRIQVKRAVQ